VQVTGSTQAVRTLALKPLEASAWSELGACAIVNNDAAEITRAQDGSECCVFCALMNFLLLRRPRCCNRDYPVDDFETKNQFTKEAAARLSRR
jgi:hypothetical protein